MRGKCVCAFIFCYYIIISLSPRLSLGSGRKRAENNVLSSVMEELKNKSIINSIGKRLVLQCLHIIIDHVYILRYPNSHFSCTLCAMLSCLYRNRY